MKGSLVPLPSRYCVWRMVGAVQSSRCGHTSHPPPVISGTQQGLSADNNGLFAISHSSFALDGDSRAGHGNAGDANHGGHCVDSD
jgi:hypothetical protein